MYKPINIPLEEFLRPFFDADETVCLRIFDDRKTGSFKGSKLEVKAAGIAKMEETLHKHNAQNRGVYFVINFGGHEDANITRINAQFVECDELSLDEQMARIEAFPLPPSLIVKTRKSLHTYWLMKNAKVGDFRRVQKKLIAHFNGDPACVNESRVFRLPGFYHCKEDPVMVECVVFSPERRYTQAELEAVLPELPDEPVTKAIVLKGTRKGLALAGKRCLFIQHCKANAATLPENLWYCMITNLAVFEDGDRAIHALSKSYPNYSYAETQNKILHFLDSGTKPITCAKIAECGFKCPKLETGECGCKAPAALCYKPLDIDTLREYLKLQEVTKSSVEDIQAAQSFVRDYLYNIDFAIAAAFIETELKAHFAFKASALKHLISLHRELYKTYKDNKETKRESEGSELPDWYEPTERGLRFVPGILADHMVKNVDAFYGAGSYYFYENGVYNITEDLTASALTRSFMISRYANMNAIIDAVSQWRMLILKPVREINSNAFIINVKNGLYNVLDASFKPHTADYYSTVQINATYDPSAKCPQFLEFVHDILPESELPLIQEIFGYLLIPVNKAQKSFVFVGAPNAGKSTLLSIAQEVLLGSENVSNIAWQALGDRFNKAELFGKLANIFADLPSKAIDDGGMFKSLTGEDYVTGERKNKNPFNFRPYARLLFSCNDIPKNYSDRSDGFYRRLLIVRFDKSVPQERRDPNLRERIASERDGILMWALEGLRRLIASNYIFSETQRTRNELQRYKIESNGALMFIEECCEVKEGAECVREQLFERYREYCIKNGMKSMSQTNFNRDVEASDIRIKRAVDKLGKRRTWRGLKPLD
jgi:putative DNA primase/helicase